MHVCIKPRVVTSFLITASTAHTPVIKARREQKIMYALECTVESRKRHKQLFTHLKRNSASARTPSMQYTCVRARERISSNQQLMFVQGNGGPGIGRGDLHTLWSEYRFPDGRSLYLKSSDGKLSTNRPLACSEVPLVIVPWNTGICSVWLKYNSLFMRASHMKPFSRKWWCICRFEEAYLQMRWAWVKLCRWCDA